MKYIYIFTAIVIFLNVIMSLINKDTGSFLGWLTAFCLCMSTILSGLRYDKLSQELEDYKRINNRDNTKNKILNN